MAQRRFAGLLRRFRAGLKNVGELNRSSSNDTGAGFTLNEAKPNRRTKSPTRQACHLIGDGLRALCSEQDTAAAHAAE
jgi:hypothetical protein